jgi:hypothetical protein
MKINSILQQQLYQIGQYEKAQQIMAVQREIQQQIQRDRMIATRVAEDRVERNRRLERVNGCNVDLEC